MDDWTALVDSSIPSSDSSIDLPVDQGMETFLWHVYKNRKCFDVQFELRSGRGTVATLTGHRLILALWSPKFADMFYGTEKRNNLERVSLEDVEPEVFEHMLWYMYGRDPPFDSVKKETELYKLATRFEIQGLAELCTKRLAGVEVDVTNVFEVLESANCTGDLDQVQKCMDIVQKKIRNILSLYDCSDFTPAMVHTVLECPQLAIKCEYELFNWLLAWAKTRYKACSEYYSIREVLQEFLPKMDFMDLTNSQFASICSQYEGVFDDKEALSIFMNIGIRDSMKLPDWCNPTDGNRDYIA